MSFNLLPMDVIKLMTDIYYTPLISYKKENLFYLILTYPSHTIKLEIPPYQYRYGKSFSRIYLIEEIIEFINCLQENKTSKIHMVENGLTIILNNDIHIIYKEINMNIQIKNTELIREQLITVFLEYMDYMYFYDHDSQNNMI